MHDLEITWPGGNASFGPDDSPVQIGRSFTADVPLQHPSVSRLHLEIGWSQSGWMVIDRSTHGTFDPTGVRLTETWTIGAEVSVRLGGVAGEELTLRPVTADVGVSRIPDEDLAESHETVIDLRPPPRPSAPPAPFGDVEADQPVFQSAAAAGGITGAPARGGDGSSIDGGDLVESSGSGAAYARHDEEDVEDRPFAETVFGDTRFEDAPVDDRPTETHSPVRSLFDDREASIPTVADRSVQSAPPGPQALDKPSFPTEPDRSFLDSTSANPSWAGSSGASDNEQLRLTIDGEHHLYEPGQTVTLGRDPDCMIYVDERHTLVSRRHLRLFFGDGTWWMEDHSSKGTYVDGRRISAPFPVRGTFTAYLGDIEGGTRLNLATAGSHESPRNYTVPVALALGLVVLGLVTWLLMSLLGGDDQPDAGAEETGHRAVVSEIDPLDLEAAHGRLPGLELG